MASESVDADLPKALVKRIVKAKLGAVDVAAGGDGTRDFQVNKDALLAFCESGKVRGGVGGAAPWQCLFAGQQGTCGRLPLL